MANEDFGKVETMRILIGWFGHETNTFSRRTTDFELLASQGFWKQKELISVFTGTPSYLGGMIRCANEHGVGLIPTLGVENAGPTMTDGCLGFVVEKLVSDIRKHKGRFDGICLALHGAGCSQSCSDIESYTLKAVRKVVGDDMPITITLDLHGNISENMCKLATGLFGIKENPHTDYEITGYEAMQAVIGAVEKKIKFKTALVKLPLLMPITHNQSGIYKSVTAYINQYKKDNGLLDAAFFPGFPYADHKDIEASVFVTADHQPEKHALHLSRYVWEKREQMYPEPAPDAAEAVKMAGDILKNRNDRLVVINEMSDNPGGGGPGDGTHLLRAMLEKNIEGSAFGYIYDPEAVQQAKAAGIGGTICVLLGGKLEDEKFHGKPVRIEKARICKLSEGNMVATTPLMSGIAGSLGDTATLEVGNLKIVVASVANQTYDDRPFFVGGIDIQQMKLLGLKSSQHFRAFYDKVATDIITADPIGIVTSNLSVFKYYHLKRPVYPLKQNAVFKHHEK